MNKLLTKIAIFIIYFVLSAFIYYVGFSHGKQHAPYLVSGNSTSTIETVTLQMAQPKFIPSGDLQADYEECKKQGGELMDFSPYSFPTEVTCIITQKNLFTDTVPKVEKSQADKRINIIYFHD